MNQEPNSQSELRELISGIKEKVESYTDNKMELYRLKFYEKLAVSGSFFAYGFVILLVLLSFLLLMLISLGLLLGVFLQNFALGFGILAILLLIALKIFSIFSRPFRKKVANWIIAVIRKIEKDDQE